jgi:hypothetical protein
MTSKKEAAALLRQAANRILEFGWVTGELGDEHRGYCALGAMSGSASCVNYAAEAFRRVLDEEITAYNDAVAKNKTDVVRALRKTARALEHGLSLSQKVNFK